MEYILTYGRILVLRTAIEAESADEAMNKAFAMELGGELDIGPLTLANPQVEVVDIQDNEEQWELQPAADA